MRNLTPRFLAEASKNFNRPVYLYSLNFSTPRFWTSCDDPIMFDGQYYSPYVISHSDLSQENGQSAEQMTLSIGNADLEMSTLFTQTEMRKKKIVIKKTFADLVFFPGTVAVPSSTIVEGIGTTFLTSFMVDDYIIITTTSGIETKKITTITNDTRLVTEAFIGTASPGTSYKRDNVLDFMGWVFFTDMISIEEEMCTINCTSRVDVVHIKLPRRTFSDKCPWVFKGVECAYPWSGKCNKTWDDCKWANHENFGGFIVIPVVES